MTAVDASVPSGASRNKIEWKLPGWTLTWPVLFFEGGFPIAVWFPRLRRAAIAAGVVFCLGVEAVTPTDTFVYQVMALLAAFIARAQARAPSR